VRLARSRVSQLSFWLLASFLLLAYGGSVFGPPPPSEHVIAISALAIWLTIPWAAWADRESCHSRVCKETHTEVVEMKRGTWE
jgi:cbb3-type cytochrome oxidase subunit 1